MKRLYEKKRNNFMGSLNVQMNTVLTLTCDSEIFFFSSEILKHFLSLSWLQIVQTLSEVLEYIYTCKELNLTNYMLECSDYLLK